MTCNLLVVQINDMFGEEYVKFNLIQIQKDQDRVWKYINLIKKFQRIFAFEFTWANLL